MYFTKLRVIFGIPPPPPPPKDSKFLYEIQLFNSFHLTYGPTFSTAHLDFSRSYHSDRQSHCIELALQFV